MTPARNIRNGALSRIQAHPYFGNFKTFRKNPSNQIQPHELPYAAAYIMPETMMAEGDYDAGAPSFVHDIEIGFSVVIRDSNADAAEDALDDACDSILNALLSDASFMGTLTEYKIEGVRKITRQHVFGNLEKSNETPVAELRLRMTFGTRTDWPPLVTDDLLRIFELARPYAGDEDTQEVDVRYEFETDNAEHESADASDATDAEVT